jgi:hypothetical protein
MMPNNKILKMEKRIYYSHPEKSSKPPEKEVQKSSTTPTKGAKAVGKTKPESEDLKERTIRTTVDMPDKWHKAVKRLLLEEDLSIKAYVLELIQKDFKSRGMNL